MDMPSALRSTVVKRILCRPRRLPATSEALAIHWSTMRLAYKGGATVVLAKSAPPNDTRDEEGITLADLKGSADFMHIDTLRWDDCR